MPGSPNVVIPANAWEPWPTITDRNQLCRRHWYARKPTIPEVMWCYPEF